MTQVECPACGHVHAVEESHCEQCGAPLAKGAAPLSPAAEEQLRRLSESLAALNDDLQEALTPARTTSFNGCGVMLLDYRPVADGQYEATRWVTLFGFPLVPLSVWKIRPRRYRQDHRGERQSFDLLDKRRISADRFFRPYLWLALGALPFLLAYYILQPIVYGVGRALGTWAAVGLVILLIISALVWVGFIMTRFHNAGTAYTQKA